MKLPEKYIATIKEILGSEYEGYLESFQAPRNYGLRVNTLKAGPEQVMALLEKEPAPIKWCDTGFYYGECFRPAKSPYYNAGLFYIQEPSAMAPASLLPIEEGDRVLDICSAPGGKSTHIGARLQNSGVLVCNDISATRCKALLKNIELAGIINACVLNETPERLSQRFEGYFNKILIDAPCSGEGMFRKDENAVKAWEEYKGEKCAVTQREILYYCEKMLAPGGVIAYSTCTFNPVENELQIADFLEKNHNFSLLAIDHDAFGISKGLRLHVEKKHQIENCGRLWPHRQRGEGHFIALIKKDGEKPAAEGNKLPVQENKIPGLAYYEAFCRENLTEKPEGELFLHGSSLMLLPAGLPPLKGLRVFRSGWYLGDLKTKRFEPSQSFAMGLKAAQYRKTIDLYIDHPLLQRYLKGESFEIDAADGWNLVCLEGFPLGWGKVKDNRLKNKYLKSWITA